MAGKFINKQQVKLYMNYRKTKTVMQESCSAKAGFSVVASIPWNLVAIILSRFK